MATEVTNNVEASRYEIFLDGELVGIADYRERGDSLVFPHTEIAPAMRGKNLGAQLVQAALDDVRGTGKRVVPSCWYVGQFIDQHPEYQDLLAA